MCEMLTVINGFYRAENHPENPEPVRTVFVLTRDASIKYRSHSTLVDVLAVSLESMAFNLVEFAKSRLKSRVPAFRKVKSFDIAFRGSAYLNFNNGTAVIMRENGVDKFYFKDLSFFRGLYREVSRFAGFDVRPWGEFLVVRQKKYRPITRKMTDVELMNMTRPALERFHGLPLPEDEIAKSLSIEGKVRQLLEFYPPKMGADASRYLELGRAVDGKSADFRKVLCHGDLWGPNILLDGEADAALIDFDKALNFSPAYDYAYFFIMSRLLTSRVEAKSLLSSLERIAEDLGTFLDSECAGTRGRFGNRELKMCVYLALFLKTVERDLRQEESGVSVKMLQAELARI